MHQAATTFVRAFFHGTRAQLEPGDTIRVGYRSNFADTTLSWVYFTGTLDAAIWGAELATGSGTQRIYVVEPTGEYIDDPNVTDKKFPGNPTLSYRSREPLRIIAEVTNWQPHAERDVERMRDLLRARALAGGAADIID